MSTNSMVIHRNFGNIIFEVERMETEKLVYSIQEVAYLLDISKSYAYELVRNGTIPSLTLGRKRVIPKEQFLRWVNSNGSGELS